MVRVLEDELDLGSEFAHFYSWSRNSIFNFAKAFNFTPTRQQEDLFYAVHRGTVLLDAPPHIAIKSGKGTGKSSAAGIVGLYRSFREYMALTVSVAPTQRQNKEIYLAEARRNIEQAPDDVKRFFKCEATTIKVCGVRDWGIKLATGSSAENAQGWHNPYLSVNMEEASGIKRVVVETMKSTLSNTDKLMLMYGNPNSRECSFHDCFTKERSLWQCLTWDARDSPLVDKNNIQRIIDVYGIDSDVARVHIYGEFPHKDPNCVMSIEDLEACTKNDPFIFARMSNAKQFGIDFARFGDDSSTIYRRHGLAIIEYRSFNKAEPDVVIGDAFQQQEALHWRDDACIYVVDSGGPGQGALHHFHNASKNVFEFAFNGTPFNSNMYDDRITEAYFMFAERVKKHEVSLPNNPRLLEQLSTRQYHMTRLSKIKLEEKQMYKDRGFDSPDDADGCVLAFYEQEMAKALVSTRQPSYRKKIVSTLRNQTGGPL